MLAFRKLFLVLALVSLTAVGASASLNTPALQCVANAGVPPIVRAEGIAELVGDLVLNCNGGYPAKFVHGVQPVNEPVAPTTQFGPDAIPQVNVQIFLNTNITSKLIGDSSGSEALLLIDEPLPAEQKICLNTASVGTTCLPTPRPWDPVNVYKPINPLSGTTSTPVYNMWQGRQAQANSLVWLGVPIDAPGTLFTRIIRITNVRANANMLGTSSTLVPTQIVMFISITGSTSVPVNNPQQTVAWIQPGMTFSVIRGGSSTSTSARSLNQCQSHNGDLFGDSTNTGACPTSKLRFTEGFASSFKTRFKNSPDVATDQNTAGALFTMSESGFFTQSNTGWNGLDGTNPTGDAGVASQGTRLRVVVNNVPAGVVAYVTLLNVGSTNVAGVGNQAKLVNVANDGSGGYVPISKVTTTGTSSGTDCASFGGGMDIALLPIFGGSGTATWEVIATDPLAIQNMEFGLVLAWSSNTSNNLPALGTVSVSGMFAPVSTVVTASSTQPVPRFADTSSARNAVNINQCLTNLLFPFVTNQQGFNTGMVISNTSKDPLGTSNQAGTCTLNYYGDTNGGAAPPAQTSGVVPAGDYLAWDLLSGGKFGVTATPGFQGYVIAQCKFQWAHGYAFISDTSMARVANGYLALILDSGLSRGSTSETLGQ